MALPTALVGAVTAPHTMAVDGRATMAFAAGIDDTSPAYLDTTRPGGVVAHPLFMVGPEWPVVLEAGRLAPDVLTRDEAKVGLHLTHDLVIHRPVRPGDVLTTTATVASVTAHRLGAFEILHLATTDQHGAPVTSTDFGMLFPGVPAIGDDGEPLTPPEPSRHRSAGPATPDQPRLAVLRPLSGATAHIYTECARIWNPIHTDPAAAQAAGLPAIILHGTATLAMAISAVVEYVADGDPTRVRRVRARFAAMVTLPSTIEIRVGDPGPTAADGRSVAGHDQVPFEVLNQAGELALRGGLVDVAPPS